MSQQCNPVTGPRNWPWKNLLKYRDVILWLEGKSEAQKAEVEIPIPIRRMLQALVENGLGAKWVELIHNSPEIPEEYVLNTRNFLIDCGFREELVDSLLVVIIYCFIEAITKSEELRIKNPSISTASMHVAIAIIIGLIGNKREETAFLILRHVESLGYKAAGRFMLNYQKASAGDKQAKREVVKQALPFLLSLFEVTIEYHDTVDELGVLYEWAEEVEDPEAMALKAGALFLLGKAGQEHDAIVIAVDAALDGSRHAWDLLSNWRSKGYGDLVLDYLLLLGSDKYDGEINTEDNEDFF